MPKQRETDPFFDQSTICTGCKHDASSCICSPCLNCNEVHPGQSCKPGDYYWVNVPSTGGSTNEAD